MLTVENRLGYDDYASLRASVGWAPLSREQVQRALQADLYHVAAVENDQVVGMGRLVGDGLYHILADLVVRPAYQGRGIGRELVRWLVACVQEQTPPGGRASIQLIAEPGKEGFYESLGFRRLPNTFCGAGMRLVLHGPEPSGGRDMCNLLAAPGAKWRHGR